MVLCVSFRFPVCFLILLFCVSCWFDFVLFVVIVGLLQFVAA